MTILRIVKVIAVVAAFIWVVGTATGQTADDVAFEDGITVTVDEQAAYGGYALFGDSSAADATEGDPVITFSRTLGDYGSARGSADADTGTLRCESIAEGTTGEHGPGFASSFVSYYRAFRIEAGTSGKSEGDPVDLALTFNFEGTLEATNAAAGVYGGIGLFSSFEVTEDWELTEAPIAYAHAGGILLHAGIFSSLTSLEDASDGGDLPDATFSAGDTDAAWAIDGFEVTGSANVGDEVLVVGFLATAGFGGINGAECLFYDTATGGVSTDDGTALVEFDPTFTPEPSTAALLATIAVGLFLRRPRR